MNIRNTNKTLLIKNFFEEDKEYKPIILNKGKKSLMVQI